MTTEDLYTIADVKRVRELLLKEQQGLDLLTKLEIPQGKAVMDHRHDDEQLVRGVLHRNVNSALGRFENSFLRDLSWWYPYSLPTFLRQAADYLELEDTRYRHNKWIDKVKTKFSALNAKQQDAVLESLGSPKGNNSKQRKELFNKAVLDRNLGFKYIADVINKVKNQTDV